LRKRASHSEKMASKEGISQDEKEFWKRFHAMSEMVTVLYEDYLEAGKRAGVSGESLLSKKEDKSEKAWQEYKYYDKEGRKALLQALHERGT
jgi:hypothetical protein